MATANTDGFVYQNQQFDLVMNTGIDLTAEVGNVSLKVRKPDGTELEVTPTILAPETEGLVQYTFSVGELDQNGDWYIKTYLIAQQTPGRAYVLTVLGEWERAGIPSAVEIRQYVEGYCVTEDRISNLWIAARRDAVIKWLEMMTRQPLNNVGEFTEYLSGNGGTILVLSRRPVSELKNLSYVIAPGDFAPSLAGVEVLKEQGMLKAKEYWEEGRYPMFPRGNHNIKVEYTAGSEKVPNELYEAVLALTAEKVLTTMANQDGGGSVSVGGYSRNYGNRGRYTDARMDLARWGISLARKYMTGVVNG